MISLPPIRSHTFAIIVCELIQKRLRSGFVIPVRAVAHIFSGRAEQSRAQTHSILPQILFNLITTTLRYRKRNKDYY